MPSYVSNNNYFNFYFLFFIITNFTMAVLYVLKARDILTYHIFRMLYSPKTDRTPF